MKRVLPVIFTVLLAATATAQHGIPQPSQARGVSQEPGQPRAWEHESSDIPVDPRIQFGHLDNGFRFAWVSNAEPKERCYVRIHVDVGALAEEAGEEGMAHFLEHMAFNGSENFEAGTLVEWFQSQGMSFGADSNAFTSVSETVYMLDLPRSDEETLQSGLQVLRDFAGGLLLESAEIDAEKGVIDGEQRERDSAKWRVQMATIANQFDGTRYRPDLIIGSVPIRAAFTAESVRAFYSKWYRPELMTLVMVGDFGGFNPEPMIRDLFADLPVPKADVPEEPHLGSASCENLVFAIDEEEIARLSIDIAHLKPWEDKADTKAKWLEDLPIYVARSILNQRLEELRKEEGSPFLRARVADASSGLRVFDGEAMSITCDPDKWEAAIAAVDYEVRRALEFGFQEAELNAVRAEQLLALDEAVERESTQSSANIVRALLHACEERSVPTDAKTDRDIYRPAIEALTVEECHEAYKQAWRGGMLSIIATGNHDLGEEADVVLRAALEKARSIEVMKGEDIRVEEFAYGSAAENAGKIAGRAENTEFDFTTVVFENGVVVNFKSTDFKDHQVLVRARVGEGVLTASDQQQVIAWVGGQVFDAGGLAAHTVDDLARVLAGRQVSGGFAADEDAFFFDASTTDEDLLLQLELFCAVLNAPGWRDDGIRQLEHQLPLVLQQMAHQPQGPLLLEFLPELFHHDPRFIPLPPQDEVLAVKMEDVRNWLSPVLARAPIEVALVGDFEIETAVAAAAQTLGALSPRRDWKDYVARRVVEAPVAGLRMDRTIQTQVPQALVMLIFPATDGIEASRRRNIDFLGEVIGDRLRVEVREKLGAAYSPGASSDASAVFPGKGMFVIQAMADPDKVDTLVDACLAVAKDLAENGVTQEEVDRLAEPILAKLRDSQRKNGYWTAILARASDPQELEDARTVEEFYRNLSIEDLSALLAEYLVPERVSILTVVPE